MKRIILACGCICIAVLSTAVALGLNYLVFGGVL